jgi:hypothetical protein
MDRLPALAWYGHFLSGLAVLAALTTDQTAPQRWHDVPLHAFGASPVVVGFTGSPSVSLCRTQIMSTPLASSIAGLEQV